MAAVRLQYSMWYDRKYDRSIGIFVYTRVSVHRVSHEPADATRTPQTIADHCVSFSSSSHSTIVSPQLFS